MDEFLKNVGTQENPTKKKLLFLAWLTKRLKETGSSTMPILVGGGAVAVYTGGNYATADIDIIYGNTKALNDILLPEGFQKEGRYWYNDEIDIVLEAPSGPPPVRTTPIVIESETVYVTSLEEIIIDRLNSYKYGRNKEDLVWAQTMFGLAVEKDVDYMKQRAREEDLLDALDLLLNREK